MIKWIIYVLGFQLIGELTNVLLKVPVPGPVIGMLLLFGLLVYQGELPKELDDLSGALLRHLYLYFIPAAVGVTAHIAMVANQVVSILVAVIVSSLLALLVAGLLMQWLGKASADHVV